MSKLRRDPGLNAALKRGREIFKSEAGFARELGITPQSLNKWEQVPPERCPAVHALTGIPLNELRPDVYPPRRVKRVSVSAHV